MTSDVALGLLLVAAGIAAMIDATLLVQTSVGGLLLATGLALLVRGLFFVRPPTEPWRLRNLVLVAVVVGGLDVLGVVDQMAFGWSVNYLMRLGPPDFAGLVLLKLAVAVALARMSRLRAFGMTLLGVLLALVGLDPITGQLRLTFGVEPLIDGISVYLVLLGVIVVADGLLSLYSPWLWLDTYVRLIARWRALDISPPAAVGMRIAAALVVAAAGVVAFYVNGRVWDVGALLVFGLFGVACKLLVWNRLVLVLGASLGPVLETSLRNSMELSRGDPAILLRWPVSAVALALAAISLALAAATTRMQRR
jgi:TctA family transporter